MKEDLCIQFCWYPWKGTCGDKLKNCLSVLVKRERILDFFDRGLCLNEFILLGFLNLIMVSRGRTCRRGLFEKYHFLGWEICSFRCHPRIDLFLRFDHHFLHILPDKREQDNFWWLCSLNFRSCFVVKARKTFMISVFCACHSLYLNYIFTITIHQFWSFP